MKSAQTQKWELIKWFLSKHKILFVFTIAYGILANLFVILIPVSLGKFFDFLFGYQSHRAAYLDKLPFSFWDTMPHYLWFLTALIVLRFIFQFLQRYYTAVLGEKFVKELREKLFVQQLKIHTEVYDDRGTGRYLLRHSGDLKSIQNYLTRGIIRFATDVILLLMAILFLLSINTTVFLVITLGFVFTVIVVYFLNKTLFKTSVKRRNTRSGLLSFVSRQLQTTKAIKAFNKEATEIGKYNKRSLKLYQSSVAFQKIYNLIYTLIPALLYGVLVVVLFYIYEIKLQEKTLFNAGEMLGFILLFITILPIFRRVIRVATVWELGNISFGKLINVFHLPTEIPIQSKKPFIFKKGELVFKNVSFSYKDEQHLFKNLNFKVKPNFINQIKLSNGQGKTTLVKLLAGLYLPNKGEIFYDNQPISQLDIKSLRKKVTFVSDEFSLIGKTVFEVISYSRSKEKRVKAQQIIDYFQNNIPSSMKLSLDDKVKERGLNLSKSQKKMLLYARAALSNKPIIVIEEPIRNLEKNTKKNILTWLSEVKNKKTIVFLCYTWREPIVKIDHVISIPKQ